MRSVAAALSAVALITACGVETTSSPTDHSGAATTSSIPPTTMDLSSTDSAPTAPAPTATGAAVEERAVLRPDGLGDVVFGTPADDALTELSAILGAPDRVETIEPAFADCVEGSSWRDCVHALRVVGAGRIAVWTTLGLEVALVDTDAAGSPAAPQFGDWQATPGSGDIRLTTPDGIHAGMTAGELTESVPGSEFTFNEGALDSFYASSSDGAGYWGRLDWDPATPDIDPVDVGAVQAALNTHGANLVVDGIWGPLSEDAWLDFLRSRGIESFTPQLWLNPEIAAALDLPPDDVTIATIEPRRPTEPTVPANTDTPFLRTDGLGRFDVGAPADELVDELTALLGPPTGEVVFAAPPPDRLHMPGGYHALHDLAQYEWSDPALRIVVGDTPYRGDRWDEPVPGTLHLLSWETTGPGLRFENGLGVGSTLHELRTFHPDVSVGNWDVCETDYEPAEFTTAGPFALRGSVDWNWVGDLQMALNELGADLEVDGIYGPATTEAVHTFQLDEGIPAEGPGQPGRIGPHVIAALGLVAPDDSTVASLAAGYRGSC